MARVRFTRYAEAQLDILAPLDQARIARKLFLLAEFPRAGHPLFQEWEGCRAVFSGHHRIIYFLTSLDEVEVIYIQPNKLVR